MTTKKQMGLVNSQKRHQISSHHVVALVDKLKVPQLTQFNLPNAYYVFCTSSLVALNPWHCLLLTTVV